MKHFKDKYVLQLLKSSKSSKEISVLFNITKRYVNKLREQLKIEGNACLINKNKGKQRKWKTNSTTEEKIISLYKTKYEKF